MAYVITDLCIGVKDASCLDVCPVDCIQPDRGDPAFEEAQQLYIDPSICIDCNICAITCPVGAIFREDEVLAQAFAAVARNADYFSSSEA